MTLYDELIAAGLPISSATEEGEISGLPGQPMTPEEQELFNDIVGAYFSPDYGNVIAAREKEEAAQTQAAAIPGWATWTEAEALAWHDTNISTALPVANLNEANALLAKQDTENKALIRMVLALRDKAFPRLGGL